ncbi:hypothetical protein [Knoellia subterranea]|uniref:Uncharacterized protein n=1 Tax=Knoellia subterranea KCTC 19937 TaxID=1385521 RepID=A0A0A0JL28_9MICO|nr:hypothetical protein [Knoellia subterranea]KGN36346.1 hypothetical protein N803_05950 [Knoellia subterranea KCTC 19937]
MVGGRSQHKLVDSMFKQVEVVRSVVGESVPVTGVLCFIESDWPLIDGDFTTRGVLVTWPKRLYALLAKDGPQAHAIADLHRRIAATLPPA